MANRDMLAEAIAEAKALKETAIANAKAALEEAFEPRLKSMLSAKLQEMEEEDLDEVVNEADSEDLDEAKRAEDKETKRTEKMKYGKDLAEGEEEELDEILAELDEMDEEKEDMNEEEEVEVDVDAEESEDEDEDIDLEEMSEDDLKSFIEDVIRDMVGSGELEAGEEFEMEDDMEVEDDMDVDMEDETEVEDEIDEIMENENKEEMEEGVMDKLKGIYNDPEVLGKLITVDGKKMSLKDFLSMAASGATAGMKKSGAGKTSSIGEAEEEMDEVKKEIEELKAELYEVNLLNAKLLYTNKIFRAKNLSENHKVKVLEAFDKAETVKEVKLVFETLNGELKEKTTIKENLGSASKPAGVAAKQPIVEVDAQVARWQKLAGIK
jgi:hypothetical protein